MFAQGYVNIIEAQAVLTVKPYAITGLLPITLSEFIQPIL